MQIKYKNKNNFNMNPSYSQPISYPPTNIQRSIPLHHGYVQNNQPMPNRLNSPADLLNIKGNESRYRLNTMGQSTFHQPPTLHGSRQVFVSQPPPHQQLHKVRSPLHHQSSTFKHPEKRSTIEYVPYESYYIDYQERQMLTSVMVPVQRQFTDYYTVEHITEYQPRQYEEKVIEMVPEERVHKKRLYLPVETEIVHYPKDQPTRIINQQRVATQPHIMNSHQQSFVRRQVTNERKTENVFQREESVQVDE